MWIRWRFEGESERFDMKAISFILKLPKLVFFHNLDKVDRN